MKINIYNIFAFAYLLLIVSLIIFGIPLFKMAIEDSILLAIPVFCVLLTLIIIAFVVGKICFEWGKEKSKKGGGE